MDGVEVDEGALEEEVENSEVLGIGDDDELVKGERTCETDEASGYCADLLVEEGDAVEGRMVVEVEKEGLDLGDVEGCRYSIRRLSVEFTWLTEKVDEG